MKTKVTVLALALLATGVALADNNAPPPGPRGPDMDKIALLLELTPEQKTQVAQAFQEQRQAMKAEFEAARNSGTRPTREEMKAKHEQFRQDLHNRLTGVLTEEQFQKLDALQDMRGPGPGPRHFGGKKKDSSSTTDSSSN